MNLPLKKIPQIINAQFIGTNLDTEIENISIDSRSLQNDEKTLFFCLTGPNNDAHLYIDQLIAKGVQHFVVTHIPENQKDKADFFVVENVLTALQQLAANYRSQFHFPIIGITGSNGKTIVKEWLNFLLAPDYNVIRSPKSYNSQVGVPLSIFGINENHNLGIFEAGISTVSEMENLQKIIQPTIGILTNIGSAHDEGFANTEEKIAEKLKLFATSDILIYQKNNVVDRFIRPNQKTFTWSFTDKNADIFVVRNEKTIDVHTQNEIASWQVDLIATNDAVVENTISCLMVLWTLKYDIATIQTRISGLYPIEMRLQIKDGINNTSLIDDSYSSDYQSLKIALDFLENQTRIHREDWQSNKHKKKSLILSDIFQSGLSIAELNSKIAALISANKMDKIITIGENILGLENEIHYPNTTEFLSKINLQQFENETILIKGARQFEFEKIVSILTQKTHETVLEINLNAISHNLNFYKSKLEPSTKIMVMVKAFGYGNGGFEIAKLLEYHKVDYLGVAFADEGIALKTAGITLPIMVLNPENSSYEAIIEHQLEPEIYSLKGLKSFLNIAENKNLKQFPIHIKLNTGMNRLGFDEDDLEALIAILKVHKSIKVVSILSHLATSDNLKQKGFAFNQIALFEALSQKMITDLQINPIRHILNTSGISNFPTEQFDMVRLGIGLYGISNNSNEQKYLENVGTLKSIISQIRTINKGSSVGYGQKFIAKKNTKIATIPIGYADGIDRHWGNSVGFVTINNQKANIVGSICMDMLMVDVTEIDCSEGDSVVIFGENPTVNYMATQLQTISYEILTSISQRVKRVFYRE
jgi:Alr-MurF fusion protein